MKWTNYHSHSNFSDGKVAPEFYILSAIEKNMYAYGFSCHSPIPFAGGWNMKFENLHTYIRHIRELQEKYKDRLNIYLGLEVDYVKNMIGVNHFLNFNLDYTIGGIHFLGFMPDGSPWDFDRAKDWFQKGLHELFSGDIKKLVLFYYEQISNMVITQKTDVLAHFDLIKKFNSGNTFFNEEDRWYREIALGTLETIAKSGIILEINTRGVLKKLNEEFYPSTFLLKRALELKMPVCLSADTHDPADTMALLPEARNLLEAIGYKEVYILDEKSWKPISIF